MKQTNYTIVIHYLGYALTNYILNTNDITNRTNLNNYNFTKKQTDVMDELLEIIKKIQIHMAEKGNYGGGLNHYWDNFDNIFNKYRKYNGGKLPSNTNKDKLIKFLVEITIEVYPTLLLQPVSSHEQISSLFRIKNEYSENFIALIRKDVLNRITNKKCKKLNYLYSFTTNENIEINIQVCIAYKVIIEQSFYNAYYKMDYSLPKVIHEIKKSIKCLRNLANKKRNSYSSFIGIKSLRLDGFDLINLNIAKIHQFKYAPNKKIKANNLASTCIKNNNYYLNGCTLEIIDNTQITSHKGTSNFPNSGKYLSHNDKILTYVQFAIIFTKNINRGNNASFEVNGFPLNYQTGNIHDKSLNCSITKINNTDISNIKKWFDLLYKTDITHIETTISRLKYAIFERWYPEDAIIDTIIAWESMFGGKSETTFKVTASIAKFLYPEYEREKKISRLKKLYGLRSEIIHGSKSKNILLKTENIENIRKEVIEIGILCLKKLLQNKDLLKLTPEKRVEKILLQ